MGLCMGHCRFGEERCCGYFLGRGFEVMVLMSVPIHSIELVLLLSLWRRSFLDMDIR